jgi:transposase
VAKVSGFRPGANPSDVQAATKFALRSVARRHRQLSEEICELDEQLDGLVAEAAPELVALEGVGTDTAASLLIAALVTIPSGSRTRQPLRTCAEPHRSQPPRARGVCAIV